ncbi:MAG: DNA alkylation repair protein [Bacteroidales bacterium]
MKTEALVNECLETLHGLADPARKESILRYFRTDQQVLGVRNPDFQLVSRQLRQMEHLREADARFWIDFARELVARNVFEAQVLAYDLLGRDRRLLDHLQPEDLPGLERGLDNWASVDTYGVVIHGVLWSKGTVSDERIRQLLSGEDVWKVRLAVVSTVPLNQASRGGTGDAGRTLWVCGSVVDDHRDMVQKALSWALRVLSKREKGLVAAFLESHEDRLAARVKREVRHKLDFGTKN